MFENCDGSNFILNSTDDATINGKILEQLIPKPIDPKIATAS